MGCLLVNADIGCCRGASQQDRAEDSGRQRDRSADDGDDVQAIRERRAQQQVHPVASGGCRLPEDLPGPAAGELLGGRVGVGDMAGQTGLSDRREKGAEDRDAEGVTELLEGGDGARAVTAVRGSGTASMAS